MNPSSKHSILGACCAVAVLGGVASSAHDGAHGAQVVQPASNDPSLLFNKVKRAVDRYRNFEVARGEGWVPATPCVSGPNEGAMGVHYVLPPPAPDLPPLRVGDGVLNPEEPEALIYEPQANGRLKLVGVEFIELAEVWDTQVGGQAQLEGHLMHLVSGPNRYALPPFYELHVWLERNPKGTFADWNTNVNCERQKGD